MGASVAAIGDFIGGLFASGAGEAAAAGAADVGASAGIGALTAADIGAGAAGLSDAAIAADLAGTAGVLGPSTTAALGAADLGAVGGALGGAAAGLPEVTITGSSSAGLGDLLIPAATGAAPLAAQALAPGQTASTLQPQPQVKEQSFLPATGASDLAPLSGDTAAQFGISPPTTDVSMDTGYQVPDSAAPADQGIGSDILNWFKKNPAQAGLLGISGLEALSKPQLPGAARTALGAAGPAVQQAEAIIQSGGTATPIWAQQKAAIDASIDQQIQQQAEALQQAAVNSGMGDKNSGVVQQQIAKMKADLEVQRQQLYFQAQQQNVSNAVAELTGSNQVLASISQMQLAQDEAARQAAAQTAELAFLLRGLG
jgi:hypothetical protein